MSDTDRQLLWRTHRGERAGAEALWRAMGPRLAGYAGATLGCGPGDAGAMDCVQQALCSVLAMKADEVAAIREPMAFLATAVRHAALEMQRKSRREVSHAERLRARFDPLHAESPQESDDGWLMRQIGTLEDPDREIVLLRHVAGMSHEQIAICLDLNRNTVASRYRRALDRLRERLVDEEQRTREEAARVAQVGNGQAGMVRQVGGVGAVGAGEVKVNA